MINITSPQDCCGCTACFNICPKKCINMTIDSEGFKYPKVDMSFCIDCGLCEKVCPVIENINIDITTAATYAAINPNERIRKESSSGGIFTAIAEKILDKRGVVFGAKFDNKWNVVHSYTESKNGLADFRGSKYVQSDLFDSYNKVKSFLKDDRLVLFSGTPCQISGLKLFLRKDYSNLICIDFICHGVPSPKAWIAYKKEMVENISNIDEISFRDKSDGWKKYSLLLKEKKRQPIKESLDINIYMKGFLSDLFLRPSCYECPSKKGLSGADITIADYWGIQHIMPEIDDDKGCSLIIINSDLGKAIFEDLSVLKYDSNIADATKYNSSYYKSVVPHKNRVKFFKLINKKNSFSKSVSICLAPSFKEKLVWKLNRLIRK